jgi:hypothetical protein
MFVSFNELHFILVATKINGKPTSKSNEGNRHNIQLRQLYVRNKHMSIKETADALSHQKSLGERV